MKTSTAFLILIVAAVIGILSSTANAKALSAQTQLEQSLERGKSRSVLKFTVYTNEAVKMVNVSVAIRAAVRGARPKCTTTKELGKVILFDCKYKIDVLELGGWFSWSRHRRIISIKPYIPFGKRTKLKE